MVAHPQRFVNAPSEHPATFARCDVSRLAVLAVERASRRLDERAA
jgi:hypothetical protein